MASKENDLYSSPASVIKQELVIKTERLEVKQELVSGDDEEVTAESALNRRTVAKGGAKDRSQDRRGGHCDSGSVTKPNKSVEGMSMDKENDQEKQLVDQCQRDNKTKEALEGGDDCDNLRIRRPRRSSSSTTNSSLKKRPEEMDSEREGSSSSPVVPVPRNSANSLLRLSGQAAGSSAEKTGPKKSNYKKLIRPAEPKPYLSCAISGALKRADKMRKKFSSCSDRARLRLMKKRRRRRHQAAGGKVIGRKGQLVKAGIRGKGASAKGKWLVKQQQQQGSKRRELVAALTNESTTSSEESLSVEVISQDKNNNNTDKEFNNNHCMLVEDDGHQSGHSNSSSGSSSSNLDVTIDLVARGHFELPIDEAEEDYLEGVADEEEVSPSKRQKLDPVLNVEASSSKSKSSKTTMKAPAKKSKSGTVTEKQRGKSEETKVPEKQKLKVKKSAAEAVAKKSNKTGKKSKVGPGKDVAEEKSESSVASIEGVVVVANTSVPDQVEERLKDEEDKDMVTVVKKKVDESTRTEKNQQQKKKKSDQLPDKAPTTETTNQNNDKVIEEEEVELESLPKILERQLTPLRVESEELIPVLSDPHEALLPAKGRPGRKPKKGGLKLSSRKRKHQQRLSRASLEEVPIKKHVGAPRWSNGWNWLGDSFQGLVFLNVSTVLER